MKQRFLLFLQIAAGAFIGSLIVENVTRFSIEMLVPIVHDVQFVFLISIISAIGGVLGAASTAAILILEKRRFQLAGWLLGTVGIWGLLLSFYLVASATEAFGQNGQPFVDALAYSGCTIACSTSLLIWGTVLLLKYGLLAQRQQRCIN